MHKTQYDNHMCMLTQIISCIHKYSMKRVSQNKDILQSKILMEKSKW
jgi:hypothetical protein